MDIEGRLTPFEPRYGVSDLRAAFDRSEFVNENHLEASILANPNLLPRELRPGGATICRQVPVSPFKPFQMDRADLCYFSENSPLPDVVIELKLKRAGSPSVKQIERYLKWFHMVAPEKAQSIRIYLLAPSFSVDKGLLKPGYRMQVEFVGLIS